MLGRLIKSLLGTDQPDKASVPKADAAAARADVPVDAAAAAVETPLEPSAIPTAPQLQPADAFNAPEDDLVIPGLPFVIRPLVCADLAHLPVIFRDSINELAARDYTTEQCAAWAASADDSRFTDALQQGVTMVADNEGLPVAFAQLDPADHLKMLYVTPDWAGLGIATLLYQYLEDEARILGARTLTTDASLTARRFFEGMGFKALAEETVERNGQPLSRQRMEKVLVRS